jgi:soluble lytic murein transglycosylase-like protein
MRPWLAILGMVALATSLYARESAVLSTGFAISHDHHEQRGAITRLFLSSGEDQYLEVETERIVSFEPDETPSSAAAPSQEPRFTSLPPRELDELVKKAAGENQLDSDFVHAVISVESNGNAAAVSRKGAQGLMQLMPATATKLGVKNAFDANENVSAGTRHLRELLARYHNDPVRALAAYNAGARRVELYHGVPPYKETLTYVAAIIRDFNRRKLQQEHAAKSSKKLAQTAGAHRADGD